MRRTLLNKGFDLSKKYSKYFVFRLENILYFDLKKRKENNLSLLIE